MDGLWIAPLLDGILDGLFFSSPEDSSSDDMSPPLDGIFDLVDGILDGLWIAPLLDGILDGLFFSSPEDSSSDDISPPLDGILDLVDGILDGLVITPLLDGILEGFFFSSPDSLSEPLDGILDGLLSFLEGMSTTVNGFFDRDSDGVWQTGAAVGASVAQCAADAMTADATKSNVSVVGAFIVE